MRDKRQTFFLRVRYPGVKRRKRGREWGKAGFSLSFSRTHTKGKSARLNEADYGATSARTRCRVFREFKGTWGAGEGERKRERERERDGELCKTADVMVVVNWDWLSKKKKKGRAASVMSFFLMIC